MTAPTPSCSRPNSASGQYPVEAVTIMDRIIKSVEGDPLYRRLMDASRREPEATTADAISAAARQCAHTLSAAAIVTYTNTGSTTLRAARERPDVRILCLTPNLNTARRMTLTWGVHPVQTEDAHNFADMVQRAVRVARKEKLAKRGRAAGDHRRRALRHAGRHEYPANRLRLGRFPISWNRQRFHEIGNARTDFRGSTGTFRSADSSRTEYALEAALLRDQPRLGECRGDRLEGRRQRGNRVRRAGHLAAGARRVEPGLVGGDRLHRRAGILGVARGAAARRSAIGDGVDRVSRRRRGLGRGDRLVALLRVLLGVLLNCLAEALKSPSLRKMITFCVPATTGSAACALPSTSAA